MASRDLCTDEIYHVYNRGVDKRVVFNNSEEYAYFIHLLFDLNIFGKVFNAKRRFNDKGRQTNSTHDGGPTSIIGGVRRERLVDVMAFVLMPNHYHLLLKQNVDGGISKFMQKLGTGYTMFFNVKHRRSGVLFQGKYKSVHVNNNRYLFYISHYIHLNPVHEKEFSSKNEKIKYLDSYKWSSYIDYVKGGNFPSVTQREEILDLFGGQNNYQKDILQFVGRKNFFEDVESLVGVM